MNTLHGVTMLTCLWLCLVELETCCAFDILSSVLFKPPYNDEAKLVLVGPRIILLSIH
jgi:hypothetical protein